MQRDALPGECWERHVDLLARQELGPHCAEAGSGRGQITGKIDAALLKRYEHCLRSRGIAVVPVREGICQGCHMKVPPQLNNILARFDSIESCPNCQRLIYRIELIGDDGEAAAS